MSGDIHLKCKMFKGTNTNNVEEEVNDFLYRNQGIELVEIKHSLGMYNVNSSFASGLIFLIIFYKEEANNDENVYD